MSQDVLSIIASFFGSFGFAIIYNIRGRRVLIPAIGGAVFWPHRTKPVATRLRP